MAGARHSLPKAAGALTRYTGQYRVGDYPQSTIAKLAMLQKEVDIQISTSPDGGLIWTTSDGAAGACGKDPDAGGSKLMRFGV